MRSFGAAEWVLIFWGPLNGGGGGVIQWVLGPACVTGGGCRPVGAGGVFTAWGCHPVVPEGVSLPGGVTPWVLGRMSLVGGVTLVGAVVMSLSGGIALWVLRGCHW